jgi:hypothetical protein
MTTDYRALCAELIYELTLAANGLINRTANDNHRALWAKDSFQAADRAKAVLARYGTPANEPVPVSKRLPGPDDCDAEGRCWIFMPDIGTDPSWRLTDPRDIGPYHTHSLPHHALPTPEATNV